MIFVPGVDIEYLKFSAGEPHVKVSNMRSTDFATVVWNFENFEEFMQVAMICDVLKRQGINKIFLKIPYMPFSRQDRASTITQPFSLKLFCNMLKTLPVDFIITWDVHSGVFEESMSVGKNPLMSVHNLSQLTCLVELEDFYPNIYDCIIAPDKGAIEKSKEIAKYLGLPLVVANKVRDPLTGNLSSPSINFMGISPERALIADDLLDGGGTFIQLADEIKKQLPNIKLDLYVTHGIFAKGRKELDKRFESIIVANDMRRFKEV